MTFDLKLFLESAEFNSIVHIDDYRTVLLIKAPAPCYPHELILLYRVDLWEHGILHEKAELAGIYQPEAHTLWDPNWDIHRLYVAMPVDLRKGLTLRTLGSRLSDVSKLATAMLQREAERGLFPVTETERGYQSSQDYIKHDLPQEAERCFMERKKPSFEYQIKLYADAMDWHETLEALIAPNSLAKRYMDSYAREKAKVLNDTIETLPLLIAAVDALEADTANPLHLRRKIADSVNLDSMQTVRIAVKREGVTLESKVDVRCIRSLLYQPKLPSHKLEWQLRLKWEAAFEGEDIRPEDILWIAYGRKRLYCRENK